MSRPRKTSDTLKSRQVSFRLTEAEYAQLQILSIRSGLRLNDLARHLIRRGERRLVIRPSRRLDPAFIAQVRAIGHNLNQLCHNAHIFGRVSPKVAEVCEQIRRVVLEAAMEDADA